MILMPDQIVATTGHRPAKMLAAMQETGNSFGMPETIDTFTAKELRRFAIRQLERCQPRRLICGMASGWDLTMAFAAHTCLVPFDAYVPFEGQERSWPKSVQIFYREMLTKAREVKIISTHSLKIAYQIRDEAMVDDAQALLAFWSGANGGTANTVRYAEGWMMETHNCWPEWIRRFTRG